MFFFYAHLRLELMTPKNWDAAGTKLRCLWRDVLEPAASGSYMYIYNIKETKKGIIIFPKSQELSCNCLPIAFIGSVLGRVREHTDSGHLSNRESSSSHDNIIRKS